ncbi:MAG: leucine-rich repeat domain-containing protein [Victivallales bacterium]|nr:leucine-rich repeat domain-containing protein [Victivallales bacterium]
MFRHRAHSYTMQVLVNRGQPANEVWYWAAEQVTLYSKTGVVRHTFSNGLGKIRYANPLTTMPITLRGTPVTAVSLPPRVSAIAASALQACGLLAQVEWPFANISSIGTQAFYQCASLDLPEIPAATCGNNIFNGCSVLSLTTLPTTLTSIPPGMFRYCYRLKVDTIPATVSTIGNFAFESCTSLTSMTFLGTPESISSSAFRSCSNLTTIRVPWSEGAVYGAPWSANAATISYNYTPS